MRFARYRAAAMSLRFRLTLWNALVVFLLAAVALVAVHEGLRLTLVKEALESLREDASEVALSVEQTYPDMELMQQEIDRQAVGHAARRMFVQVVDEQGAMLLASLHAPGELNLPRPNSPAPRTLASGEFRIAQRSVPLAGGLRVWVRVGMSFEFIQADVARVTRITFLVGCALLLLSPIGGYWLAGRATRPLGDILSTAQRLRPSRLTERLPTSGAGDELDQLSETINGLLDRISTYLDRHRDFVANAAHELRSPLAAIRSSIEVTLNAPRSVERYQALLASLMEECERLSFLVNQLLELAESDAGCLEREASAARLDEVVARSVEMFRPVAEDRSIELAVSIRGSATIRADARRLWQVVNNLIDNALKFTPDGGRIDVELDVVSESRQATLIVRDSGVGIAPADLPRVFERFYRTAQAREHDREGGNGLGLSICQAIVADYGGHVSATSEPGRGAEFRVVLPTAFVHSAAASTSSPSSADDPRAAPFVTT